MLRVVDMASRPRAKLINPAASCKTNQNCLSPYHETAMFIPKQCPRRSSTAQSLVRALSKRVPKSLQRLAVTVLPKTSLNAPPRGRLCAGFTSFPCAIGAASVSRRKKEGDLASPAGHFRLLGGFFRPTAARPTAAWPLQPIRKADGWCDDPRSPAYNRPMRLPSRYNCEKLWRNDGLYDLIIILDYNLWPRHKGKGSAIFLHCARPDFSPTAGCIAVRPADLRRLLPRLSRETVLVVR